MAYTCEVCGSENAKKNNYGNGYTCQSFIGNAH